jgi:hypothetical protein
MILTSRCRAASRYGGDEDGKMTAWLLSTLLLLVHARCRLSRICRRDFDARVFVGSFLDDFRDSSLDVRPKVNRFETLSEILSARLATVGGTTIDSSDGEKSHHDRMANGRRILRGTWLASVKERTRRGVIKASQRRVDWVRAAPPPPKRHRAVRPFRSPLGRYADIE